MKHLTCHRFATMILLGITMAFLQKADAQLIQVQFGNGSTPLQSGYTLFTAAGSQTVNGYGVTIATPADGFFFNNHTIPPNSGAFTYSNLYTGFVGINTADPSDVISATITGLTPNTAYALTIYSLDGDNHAAYTGGTWTITQGTGGSISLDSTGFGPSGSNGTITSNQQFAGVLNVMSDASGDLAVALTFPGADPRWNGFDLSAVPEPSTVVLAILGGIGLCIVAIRRRQQASL